MKIKQYKNDIKNTEEIIADLYQKIHNIRAYYRKNRIIVKKKEDIQRMHDITDVILYLLNKHTHETTNTKIELDNHHNDIEYNIIIGDTKEKLQLFVLFLILCKARSLKKKHHVGIDCEFRLRKIALMQLNFEIKLVYGQRYIWIIDPSELDESMMNVFINNIMINNQIKKILHGSDSLDIPYIYHEMFNDNKETISKFSNKMVDTKLLCEYYKACNKEDNKICSIYDALLHFHVITKERYDYLNNTNQLMGPVQDIMWNIHKLSSFHVKYAYYDVLYLKYLVMNIYKGAKDNIAKYYKSFYYIDKITKFIYIEKQNITNISEKAKQEIDPINNYIIRYKGGNQTLINIYNETIKNMMIQEIEMNIDNIMEINYFRQYLHIWFKRIIYGILTTKYQIYKNKKDLYTEKLVNDVFIQEIAVLHGKKLEKMMLLFKHYATNKIEKHIFSA